MSEMPIIIGRPVLFAGTIHIYVQEVVWDKAAVQIKIIHYTTYSPKLASSVDLGTGLCISIYTIYLPTRRVFIVRCLFRSLGQIYFICHSRYNNILPQIVPHACDISPCNICCNITWATQLLIIIWHYWWYKSKTSLSLGSS